jgi:hypothetical protein
MLYLDKIVGILSIAIIIGVFVYLCLELKNKMNTKSSTTNVHNNIKDYADCPNFFEIINDRGQKMCKNVYKLGKCNISDNNKISAFFDEKDEFFTDKKRGDLRKCLWAKECDVSWDGIDRLC